MTSLREVEQGLEVRMFNPGETEIQAILDFSRQPANAKKMGSAQFVDFESHPTSPVMAIENQRLEIKFNPKQILTLRFI